MPDLLTLAFFLTLSICPYVVLALRAVSDVSSFPLCIPQTLPASQSNLRFVHMPLLLVLAVLLDAPGSRRAAVKRQQTRASSYRPFCLP